MYGYGNNNNYGYGYQPYPNYGDNMAMFRQAQPQQMPQQTQQPTQTNEIIWVQGEAGAKSYLVARGETAVLWDSENPVIYIKSADMSGMPSMRVFEISEKVGAGGVSQAKPTEAVDYVTRAEFDELKRQFDSIRNTEPTAKKRKDEGGNNNG